MRTVSSRWVLPVVMFGLAAPVGCGSSSAPTSGAERAQNVTGTVTVSAAASLTEAFTEIGADFERANPGASVAFNFGSSGTLATQIRQGAPADTFASADRETMAKLETAGLVRGAPVVFARNRLVVVTKPGNPEHVRSLADLARLGVVSLCAETVPCGTYAAQILRSAGVTIPDRTITRGQDVKTTLGAVTTGDADAAVVYVTDAKSAGRAVTTVAIPDARNAIAVYPIATTTAATNAAASRAFIEYVTSPRGQATVRSFGFLPPS